MPPATKTHCQNGHLLDEANIFRCVSGQRFCRICYKRRHGKEPSLSADRPAKRLGRCVCTGDLVKPLRNKEVWICLKCGVGSIRGSHDPIYVSADDAEDYLQDKITLEELLRPGR